MTFHTIRYGLSAGFVGGIILGFFLRFIELGTGSKVYTLLLNIDFVPGVKTRLAEPIEFAIHLAVSLVIGLLFMWWIERGVARFANLPTRMFHPLAGSILFGLAPILLFVPLTLSSDRVPAITDMVALGWWSLGHLIYALVLLGYGYFARLTKNMY
jgi:hypothetical protein